MKELIEKLKEIQAAFIGMARETSGPEPDTISWNAFRIAETCGKEADALKREIPQEIEMEGGGTTWWPVCPECHGSLTSTNDCYCRHCGQRVK